MSLAPNATLSSVLELISSKRKIDKTRVAFKNVKVTKLLSDLIDVMCIIIIILVLVQFSASVDILIVSKICLVYNQMCRMKENSRY